MNEITEQASLELASAPVEIKLAVDLIQLLEESDIELEVTIQALEIVLTDFKNKRKLPNSNQEN